MQLPRRAAYDQIKPLSVPGAPPAPTGGVTGILVGFNYTSDVIVRFNLRQILFVRNLL